MTAQIQALSGALDDFANQLRYSCSRTGRPKAAIGERPPLQVMRKISISVNSGYVSCAGFEGACVLVKNLFDYLEGASSLEDFLEDFPSVSREKAVAVLEAARERLSIDALTA